jgi:hypothetical protein
MSKMTPDWARDAAAFGLDADEALEHWTAWEDLQRLRPKAFVEQTLRESQALLRAMQAGEPPDLAAVRRLKTRNAIIQTFAEAASQEIIEENLRTFKGIAH